MKNQCINFFTTKKDMIYVLTLPRAMQKIRLSGMLIDLFYFHGVMFHSILKKK